MQEKISYIKASEVEYPLVFNLNVMEKIQEKYETIEKWGELTDGNKCEVNIKAFKFGIKEMINEGIDIENEKQENKREFVTDKQVGRIITDLGMEKILHESQNVIIEATKNDEDNSKNE